MSEAKSESTESLAGTTPPAKTPPANTPPTEPSKQSVLRRYYPAAVPVILGLIIYFMPVPDGVDPKGMHMLGIFVGTIVALILQPLPTGSVALVGLSIAMITQTETPTEALSGFSNTTIWLIVASFFIAEGFLVTGLGKRVALMFVTKLGKSSLGLSYGMALTDLILAPATPSNTARAGGVVYPIIVSLSKLEDSNPEPEDSRKKLGAYLLLTSLQVNVVTSAMFITAMAGNPVAVDAAAKIGIDISWGKWALAASVPGIASLIAIPWVMSKIFPPTMLKTPKAPEQAREELRKAGPISRNEKIMAATFVLLLVLWCLGSQLNVNATTTAFVGIGILLVTKVLTWNNLVHDTGAWQTLVFFAVLVGMASHLEELGVISWIGTQVSSSVDGLPWIWAFAILTLVYFYAHYLFASNTAQIVAMYAVFLGAAVATGAPPLFSALVFGFIGSLFGGISHYASGPAGVIYGSGYIKTSEWFRIGFVMSVVIILIWTIIGGAWMKLIGAW
ncbi:anion permease [Rhodococcus erythropolis]|uniref:Anion permease n=1 Tax=Rhodococcus erythropolis TaxID=1833 RepID=A0AAP4RSC4_RHOER|nr:MULTISPECIES: anion permease [Rhodococcus]ATI35670.1 anion permease [Rhodococcus sp. H-CA8f]MBF7733204.1 anion permease [Rhodococcus erythropolis]MBO8144869.1 anion permease [Rhodococcus erythropolis]MBS2991588.1 anion permease [Rhodococcus erythropolis]MCS4253746.1 DASS family divalent anion:Na+ symporter [Rhodococcus erythropolis]